MRFCRRRMQTLHEGWAQAGPSLPSLQRTHQNVTIRKKSGWSLKAVSRVPVRHNVSTLDRFTANHGFFTPELLETIQQLGPVLQPSLSFRRTGLAPCLWIGNELSLHVSAQQWGFSPAHATLWCTGMTVNEFFLLKALIQTLQIMVDTMPNRIMALAYKKVNITMSFF